MGRTGGLVGRVRQPDELLRFRELHHASAWRWPDRTLIAVDYAAASGRVLRASLDELARDDAAPGGMPLRILLLERHADRDTGWWSDLVSPGGLSGPGAEALIEPSAPLALGQLRALADRRALLAQAMAKAAALLDRPLPPLPAPGADPAFDRRLDGEAIETEPLFLLMAGIVAVDEGAPSALALGRLDLARIVAGAERSRLQRIGRAAGVDDTLLLHLAACITLQAGCDAAAAGSLIDQERLALGDRSIIRSDQLAGLLRDALPPTQGSGIDAVRPDLIGEAFLLGELRPPSRQTEAVERAFGRDAAATIATVIRTAQDYAESEATHRGVAWLEHLAGLTDDPFALIAIAAALPEHTLALRERAVETTGRIVAGLADRVADDRDLLPLYAGWTNNFAIRLSELGDREAALSAAREAAELYRALAVRRPDAFRPDLAGSLNTLAIRLSAVGDREAALSAAREAADLYRALAAQRPDAFRPDLARSLNTLANMLSAVGDREAALSAAREAAELYRALAAQRPDAFRPDLAMSLNNLANRLSAVGDREAALSAAREAVDIRRALAAQRPDAFRPGLATSLWVLADCLDAMDRREEGLTANAEAIAVLSPLFQRHKAAFASRIRGMVQEYVARGEALEREPDQQLLAPVIAALQDLDSERPQVERP